MNLNPMVSIFASINQRFEAVKGYAHCEGLLSAMGLSAAGAEYAQRSLEFKELD